jgi:hypothetical protein
MKIFKLGALRKMALILFKMKFTILKCHTIFVTLIISQTIHIIIPVLRIQLTILNIELNSVSILKMNYFMFCVIQFARESGNWRTHIHVYC